jgi:hypothetical protein
LEGSELQEASMAMFTTALRSMAGERPVDRIVLAASILFLVFAALEVRTTVAGMSVDVTIASIEVSDQ